VLTLLPLLELVHHAPVRGARGQATADPAIALMKARRRIAFSKAQDHASSAHYSGI
jgi:hypothetical protein